MNDEHEANLLKLLPKSEIDWKHVAITAKTDDHGKFWPVNRGALPSKIRAARDDESINTVVIAENQIPQEQRNEFFKKLSIVERDEFNSKKLNFEHAFYSLPNRDFWVVVASSLDDCVSKLYASQNVRRKPEDTIEQLILRDQLAKFKEEITKYAFEWESKIDEARTLAEAGKIKEGHDAFMQSANAMNKIINCYRTHKFLFTVEIRNKIDKMLLDSESGNEDSLLVLIEAVQLINFEIETALEEHMRNEI